ncbi:MAG: glycosyltransferase [Acetatifactor sp.]
MKDKPIVLSISMLISGREEMARSLDSLHYFTEAFPCEIILVDTGCNPSQRALAEKYADKIIDFTWCNDFSAARNAGLKEARGEWFMYLDDDEWFENPKQIVSFFTSGEYKNYKCASYIQRNYMDMQGAQYDDSYPSRMIKLTDKTRFFGKIHECLGPYEMPKKEFEDFVHHYGYVYKDEEDKRKHARRNIVPLLEMRKEYPGDPRWMCQLAQEYFMLNEYEEIVRVCREGLEEFDRLKENHLVYAPAHIGAIYGYLLISLETLKRYEEEKVWLKRAFEDPNMKMSIMVPDLAFYCMAGAKLYNFTGDYRQSRDYLRRYIDYVKRYRGDRKLLEDGAALVVASVFQEIILYGTVLGCLDSAVRMQDSELAEEAFYMLDWQDWRLLNQYESEQKILDAFCSVPYHPSWVKMLQTLVARPEGMKEMLVVLLESEIQWKQQGENDKISRLRRLLSELDFEHWYVLCARILWTAENPDQGSGEEHRRKLILLFEELFAKYQEKIPEVKSEIWEIADRQKISPDELLQRTDYHHWKQTMDKWCREAGTWEIRRWEERTALWKQQAEARRTLLLLDLFEVKCTEGLLYHYEEACPDLFGMEQTLWKYADRVLALYESVYEPFVFRELPEVLPPEAQLALRLKQVQSFRKDGNDLKMLEGVRSCLEVCDVLEEPIKAYAKLCRDVVQKRTGEAYEAQKELAQLAATLKNVARQQIDKGELQAARDILLQVKKYTPEDKEVEDLLSKITDENIL